MVSPPNYGKNSARSLIQNKVIYHGHKRRRRKMRAKIFIPAPGGRRWREKREREREERARKTNFSLPLMATICENVHNTISLAVQRLEVIITELYHVLFQRITAGARGKKIFGPPEYLSRAHCYNNAVPRARGRDYKPTLFYIYIYIYV